MAGIFSVSADFSNSLKKITKNVKMRVDSYQVGGEGRLTHNCRWHYQKSASFAQDVSKKPVPFVVFIQDYMVLDMPSMPNFVDIENARLVFIQFFRLRNKLVGYLNDIAYIEEHPEQFEEVDQFDLAGTRNKIQNWLDSITQSASRRANKVLECKFETPPEIEIIKLPKRKDVFEESDQNIPVWNRPWNPWQNVGGISSS